MELRIQCYSKLVKVWCVLSSGLYGQKHFPTGYMTAPATCVSLRKELSSKPFCKLKRPAQNLTVQRLSLQLHMGFGYSTLSQQFPRWFLYLLAAPLARWQVWFGVSEEHRTFLSASLLAVGQMHWKLSAGASLFICVDCYLQSLWIPLCWLVSHLSYIC